MTHPVSASIRRDDTYFYTTIIKLKNKLWKK